jgi:hypothetical protein
MENTQQEQISIFSLAVKSRSYPTITVMSRHSCGQVLLYLYETDFTQGLLKKKIL